MAWKHNINEINNYFRNSESNILPKLFSTELYNRGLGINIHLFDIKNTSTNKKQMSNFATDRIVIYSHLFSKFWYSFEEKKL